MKWVAIHTDCNNPKTRSRKLLIELFHRRHFSTTGRAPRRPNVDQHDLAAIIGDGGRLVGAQITGGEVRRARPDLDGVELGPQLDCERDAEHGRHPHARDQRPLLPVRHAVTMQRRRSSCTSRAGSALAKMAWPATKVSAPA